MWLHVKDSRFKSVGFHHSKVCMCCFCVPACLYVCVMLKWSNLTAVCFLVLVWQIDDSISYRDGVLICMHCPLLNRKAWEAHAAPQRKGWNGTPALRTRGGRETNLQETCPNTGLLLHRLSQGIRAWRPQRRQRSVEFHEGDWCYISNKPKRLLI